MKSPKGKGFLHVGSRAWWICMCVVGLLFLGCCYNYTYHHSDGSTRRTMDAQREWFMNRIPDYHPKKQTKGTRRAQNTEKAVKDTIRNRGN